MKTAQAPIIGKKKDPPAPVIDEKRENMKNALFAGMGGSTKKDEDSDSEEKKKEPEAPTQEMNLLDMDSGPSQPSNNLLDTPSSQPPSGDLLDMMSDPQPAPM